MTEPYSPSASELPVERVLVFADGSSTVHRLNESTLLEGGSSVTGVWQSPSLSRLRVGAEHELIRLMLLYSYTGASATTLTVRASGDGGQTWNESREYSLNPTEGAIHRAWRRFNTAGPDLRFQVELDTDEIVLIHGYIPRILPRGSLGSE